MAIAQVFLLYVAVAALQLAYQAALGYLAITQQAVWPYLVGKAGQQRRITPEATEHPAQLPHVGAEQAVAQRAVYLMDQPFAGQELMSVPDVRQVLFSPCQPSYYDKLLISSRAGTGRATTLTSATGTDSGPERGTATA